jgi:hypothetical protein
MSLAAGAGGGSEDDANPRAASTAAPRQPARTLSYDARQFIDIGAGLPTQGNVHEVRYIRLHCGNRAHTAITATGTSQQK